MRGSCMVFARVDKSCSSHLPFCVLKYGKERITGLEMMLGSIHQLPSADIVEIEDVENLNSIGLEHEIVVVLETSLVAKPCGFELDYVPSKDDAVTIVMEDVKEEIYYWDMAIIVYALGEKVPFAAMEEYVKSQMEACAYSVDFAS
ncbi:hypothetical protein Ancab_031860 [Ancistrocladus abbreviatus]